jgi:tetratricopeptide (TPR) repeat protein
MANRDKAVEAYNHSAELAVNPAQAYFNICAVLYNSGNTTDTPAACRRCLEVDPGKADAWFILGSVLFANSPVDTKGNMAVSADTRQALNKYLELAPGGPHPADVKAMLQMAGK